MGYVKTNLGKLALSKIDLHLHDFFLIRGGGEAEAMVSSAPIRMSRAATACVLF